MSNLLTSYSGDNFILIDDYKMKVNSLDVGQPEVAVQLSGSLSSSTPTVEVVTWKRGIMEESVRFKYIGMSYDTAKTCANDMRGRFTYQKKAWCYGDYIEDGNWLIGWHSKYNTPTLDSNITIQKHGNGCMYDVVVDAHATIENYTRGGYAALTGSRPIADTLAYIPGFNDNPTLDGQHFDAAGADNIVLVNAPTRTINYELVGANIYTTMISADGEIKLKESNWYRRTVDSYCQVKYEGMTRAACKSLYNSVATFSNSGWYVQQHPWELSAWFDNTQQLNIKWRENTNVTSWQCLNDYRATEGDSGLFTAELTLHAQEITMTDNPTS